MSSQFRSLLTAEQFVSTLLRMHPEDEAMAKAVGGDFERIGVLEHAVLRGAGLAPNSLVVDVGCGSGRLAARLAAVPGLRYLGTDVVPALLDYARRKAGRADFRFVGVDRIGIPVADGEADLVCFFSVFTHLLPEESYLYLEEARRALKPGGRVVFSFLEYGTRAGWHSFEASLDWVRQRSIAGNLNVFLNRADIRLWASRLGFVLEEMQPGDRRAVRVDADLATAAVPEGGHAFGRSLCVLRKPREGEAPPAPPEEDAAGSPPRRKMRDRGPRRRGAEAAPADPGERPSRRSASAEAGGAAGRRQVGPDQGGAEGSRRAARLAREKGAGPGRARRGDQSPPG